MQGIIFLFYSQVFSQRQPEAKRHMAREWWVFHHLCLFTRPSFHPNASTLMHTRSIHAYVSSNREFGIGFDSRCHSFDTQSSTVIVAVDIIINLLMSSELVDARQILPHFIKINFFLFNADPEAHGQ